ncbi:hypothetical protein E1171_02960, partial [Cytophagales bacterium RKSG123]|nr:hypothetical protein [Xanthovirga aplysinae]
MNNMIKNYLTIYFILLLVCCNNIALSQELVFAKRIGSDSPDMSSEQESSIVLDEEGNFYITGSIGSGSIGAVFGEGETNETTMNINGSFVAKYSASQELLWVQQMEASTSYAIDIDVSGNVYVSGTFFQEATFGVGQTNETTLSGISGEIFIAKYDPNGNLLWAINEGGDNDDNPGGRALIVDDSGNIYLTGTFWGTVTFGEGEPNETTLTSESSTFLLAKYDTDGSLIWIQKASSGSNHSGGKNIDLDEQGNVFITGNYFNSVTFGEGLSNETTLNDGNESSFIVKFDNKGNFIWAIDPFIGGASDISGDLKIDKTGSVLFAGSFTSTILLGEGTDREIQLSSVGSEDIILAKYSSEGGFLWAKTAGSIEDDRGIGLAIDTNSNVFITGYYGGEIQFGINERNDTTILNSGASDFFVAKFSPSGEFIWVTSAGEEEWDQGNDIEVDGQGNIYVTGFYRSNIIFGKDEPNETSLPIEGFNDIFFSKFQRSFNAQPEFEIIGEKSFQEDFIGNHSLEIHQINTPSDEIDQVVSYSISPDDSELVEFSFNQSTGILEISSVENKFGEQTFLITSDDGEKENYSYSKELTIKIEPINDLPQIIELKNEISIPEDNSLEILLTDLVVTDVDNDYPSDFSLTVLDGENYSVTNNEITPALDFSGILNIPISVNDGMAESEIFQLSIEVLSVNDIPVITGISTPLTTFEE